MIPISPNNGSNRTFMELKSEKGTSFSIANLF